MKKQHQSFFKLLPKWLALLFLIFCTAQNIFAQTKDINGVIKDETGEPLIGVSVVLKRTNTGTATDLNGEFTLKCEIGDIITISYIGYSETKVTVNSDKKLNIVLKENTTTLDEVVVVGYGVQKKVNLTGAVAAVDGKEIAEKRNANALASLQGVIPGLTVLRSGGQPGSETSNLRIRGLSSSNAMATLVLIDGVEGDIALLNSDDIESVSVLKDAAAASIYGARAAGGVILVTTKKGEAGQRTKIIYNGSVGINLPSRMPERLTAWDEQTLINLSRINSSVDPVTGIANGNPEFDPEKSSWIGNPNYNYRPNGQRWDYFESNNWIAEGVKDETLSHDHSLSMMGGSDKTKYYLSAGYHYKDGLLRYGPDKNDRKNIRLTIDTELNKYISVNLLATYQANVIKQSAYGSTNILSALYSGRGRQPIYIPEEDTNYAVNSYNGDLQVNPIDLMKNSGTNTSKTEFYTGKIGIQLKNFVKDFTIDLNASRRASYHMKDVEKRSLIWHGKDGVGNRSNNGNSSLNKVRYSAYLDKLEALFNYSYSLDNHNFHALFGMSYEQYEKDELNVTAQNMLSNDFFSLNFYDDAVATNSRLSDLIQPWKMASLFGRLTYNYKERYLFEANLRYDGSSRLDPDYRWEVFPSFSAAWRANEEAWFEPLREHVSNLKLRGSWGRLGNSTALGYFDYLGLINNKVRSSSSVISVVGNPAYYQKDMVSRDLSWEILESTNIGVDLGVLNGRLNMTADYYWKRNKNMLAAVKVGNLVGATVPHQNVGELKAWGWEVSANWHDKIGEVTYNIGFNIEDSQNEVVKYAGVRTVSEGRNGIIEGYPLNSIWGYKTDGYWSSRQEYLDYKTANPGYQSFNDNMVTGGDIKYLPNGQADHTLVGGGTPENPGDLVYLGSENARYMYGINLGVQWKGFDFSMFFQGVGKRSFLLTDDITAPLKYSYQMPWSIHLDYWSEDNPNAFFPRVINQNTYNYKPSDKWVQDGSYIRLKNIQLGYTIPISKKYIQSLRVYVAGTDVWEHTNVLDVVDPEVGGSQGRNYYPFFRTWTTGVNLTF